MELKITLEELSNSANQLRAINKRLDETLNFVKKNMNELNTIWESLGEKAINERFMSFSKNFVDEYETIEAYARFLDDTVATYDSLESTIKANANNFD